MFSRRSSWQLSDATRDIAIATNALAELERQSLEFEIRLDLWSAECDKIIRALKGHQFTFEVGERRREQSDIEISSSLYDEPPISNIKSNASAESAFSLNDAEFGFVI